MKKQEPRVIRGRTELIVPHRDTELVLVHPAEGPNNYQSVAKGLLSKGLELPTGEQTASLLYGAYSSQEPEFRNIQDIMKKNWLWVFNKNLWTPEGVYVVQDREGKNQELDQNDLEKRLNTGNEDSGLRFSEDKTVRFAPKGSYKLGDHTPKSLAEDGFIIASFGKEGAEKLGELAEHFRENPYLWGLEPSEMHYQTVSALYSVWCGRRLLVYGNYLGDDWSGCAFGVSKTGEASRAEK